MFINTDRASDSNVLQRSGAHLNADLCALGFLSDVFFL